MKRWLTLILILVGLSTFAQAQEWTRFRGLNGSGVSATRLPVKWTDKDYAWKIRLPGIGHSSPVVWGKRIFVTCGDEKTGQRIILCVSMEGKTLWKQTFDGEKSRKHRDNSFASSTPTVDGDLLYVYWGGAKKCEIMALSHDGKLAWRAELGGFKSGHGFGPSPIVYEDLLIVPHDQGGAGALYGFDRRTGKLVWRHKRKGKASWSTPCIYQPRGKPDQLIFTNYEHGVTGIDPRTGKLLWEMDIFYKKHMESAIASPITQGEMIFASCGWMGVNQEVVALRPSRDNQKPVYTINRSAPLCTTPLVKDDLLFMWNDRGIVTCADVKTGKEHWRQRVSGGWYSSPVCAGDVIYNISRKGEVVAIAASKEYKLLGRSDLGEGSHSTPAIANGRMIVQTFTHLMVIKGSNEGQ